MTLVREAAQAGVPVAPLEADTDKLTRALPYSVRVETGRVWLPAGAWWTKQWVDEHAAFPNGRNDDQVDTGAYATRVAITGWHPQAPPPSTTPPVRSPLTDDPQPAEREITDWFAVQM
jgi:hypothetical protein